MKMKADSKSSTKRRRHAAKPARQPLPDAEELKQLDAAGGMEGGMEEGSASGLRQAYVDARTGGPRKKPAGSKAMKD